MTSPVAFHEEEALGKAYDGRLMRRLLGYARPYLALVAAALAARPAAQAAALLDQLILATDVYAWKLLRRDMRHSAAEAEALIAGLIARLLSEGVD
jgi:hypothetical protein